MPTLDLFTPRPPALADAWHDVRAPGGYEWWYFDAEDRATDTQLVAIFLHGFVFHPGYLRQYARYLKKPTRVAPPVASDFPCAYFVVYRNGNILHQFMTQYGKNEFHASTESVDVRIGPNTIISDDNTASAQGVVLPTGQQRALNPTLSLALSGAPWKLTGRGPQTIKRQTLDAALNFRPLLTHPPDERRFFSRAMTGADHHWVVAGPLCAVAGTISLTEAGSTETIQFAGRGYHDHNYGTGPIGPGLKQWIWGRAFLGDHDARRVVTFHYARPADSSLPNELHLTEADDSRWQNHELDAGQVEVDWSARTMLLLAYPKQLKFGDVLSLSRPRVVDSQPFYLRLVYDVVSRGESGTAFCEVAYPTRLRWPVLGRMIEMSIDRRDRSGKTDGSL